MKEAQPNGKTIQLENGIKSKPQKPQNLMTKIYLKKVAAIFAGFLSMLFLTCTPLADVEKEIWEIPCGYEGYLTVYFADTKGQNSSKERIYRFSEKGVAYSEFNENYGFTEDVNKSMILLVLCNQQIDTLKYFDNAVLDTLTAKYYATNLIVGEENGRSYTSIFIVKK